MAPNPFGSLDVLTLSSGKANVYRLSALAKQHLADVDHLPFSIRILLENVLRHAGNGVVTKDHARAVGAWTPKPDQSVEVTFIPSRRILQACTAASCVVELAAMRDAFSRLTTHLD